MNPPLNVETLRAMIAQHEQAIELVQRKRDALKSLANARHAKDSHIIEAERDAVGTEYKSEWIDRLMAVRDAQFAYDLAELAIIDANQDAAHAQLDEMRKGLTQMESPLFRATLNGGSLIK